MLVHMGITKMFLLKMATFFFFAILPLQGKSNGLFFPHFLTMRKNHNQFFLLVFNSENFEKQKIHDVKGNIIFI